jgi:hypothetical protein
VPLADITREAVLSALHEHDKLGVTAFRKTYGFQPARRYLLKHNGKSYDSTAIAGVAHKYALDGPLRPKDFSGGEATVVAKLIELGFEIDDRGPYEANLDLIDRSLTVSQLDVVRPADHSYLVGAVGQLRARGTSNGTNRHQALLLLWAMGRARVHEPRLAQWSSIRKELTDLLSKHGLDETHPTPQYPFVALASTVFWEVATSKPVPVAHGSQVLTWLNAEDPPAGLRPEVYDLMARGNKARAEVAAALLDRFFKGDAAADMLRSVHLLSLAGTPLEAGDVARRKTIHEIYGGQEQGGISTPADHRNTLLFSDPDGANYGYTDGWKDDGSYHYTGQGTEGDQGFTSANRAVLDKQRSIHIFETAKDTVIRYLGQFLPDREDPYYREDAPDKNGEQRSVIVFRLWPNSGEPPSVDETVIHVARDAEPKLIPIEANNILSYVAQAPREQAQRERRESQLVQRYVAWLDSEHGHETGRNSILLPDQSSPLLTDIFNVTTHELIEAKGTTTRNDIRAAIGQLFDYRRRVDHTSLAALVPVRPAEDLVELLTSLGISCIYERSNGQFERVDPVPVLQESVPD